MKVYHPGTITKTIINGCTSARCTNPDLHRGIWDTTMAEKLTKYVINKLIYVNKLINFNSFMSI